jgi:hypothetical protein
MSDKPEESKPTKEELKMRLRMKMGSAKMARLPANVKTEKIDKLKTGLDEILKPTGMTADDFLNRMSGGKH